MNTLIRQIIAQVVPYYYGNLPVGSIMEPRFIWDIERLLGSQLGEEANYDLLGV